MVKKMKRSPAATEAKARTAAAGQGSQLAAAVKESAQQIWLAGMGAFAKAQEEGTKVFEALVKEGLNLQKRTQGMAEEKIGEVTGKVTAMADSVTARAGQNWDKLEAIFEQRTAKAMNRLGVPTAKDVDALTQRVDELAAAVAKLSKRAPAGRTAAAPAAPVKTSAKATRAPAASKRAARKPAASRKQAEAAQAGDAAA